MSNEIKVKDLLWDKVNREHIKPHDLTPKQVEQVFIESKYIIAPAKNGRYNVLGTSGRRMLSVILNRQGRKYYVVTARDASTRERQIYRDILSK